MAVDYRQIEAAVASVGMIARGGFAAAAWTDAEHPLPRLSDGRRTVGVVVVGNVGGSMWTHFRRGRRVEHDPLDAWTRRELGSIARSFDAGFVHPSDRPFQPFQRWAQLADDVWPSPIGLLIHAEHGLWHAYRGALLFASEVTGLPHRSGGDPPCVSCVDQPCRTACPVGAFSDAGYDSSACRGHVRSGADPVCLDDGCAARRACPVNRAGRYGAEQMRFHMEAFVAPPSTDGPDPG